LEIDLDQGSFPSVEVEREYVNLLENRSLTVIQKMLAAIFSKTTVFDKQGNELSATSAVLNMVRSLYSSMSSNKFLPWFSSADIHTQDLHQFLKLTMESWLTAEELSDRVDTIMSSNRLSSKKLYSTFLQF